MRDSRSVQQAFGPTREKRSGLRHISEATRPLLRGWLDRFNRTCVEAGLEPHERLELFLSLPPDEQADHFAQLREYERGERILDGDLDWPRSPAMAIATCARVHKRTGSSPAP